MFFSKKPKSARRQRSSPTPSAHLRVETLESRLVLYSVSGDAWDAGSFAAISEMVRAKLRLPK